MKRLELIELLKNTVDRLCADCRDEVPFNMSGSHAFAPHHRECRAIELRKAIKELEKDNV